ncbi:MAG: SDR family oxidoreductase [Planctomycetales bacterium]|nr:SDR family oxidoreductase [Planctomycetales bacterium]
MRLDGHTALITGGTQGVGAAIALRLANAGCNLIVHGLRADDACEQTNLACRATGVGVENIFEDLSERSDVALEKFSAQLGKRIRDVTILVNNVGTFIDLPFLEMDYDRYQRTFNLNVSAGYFLTQTLARHWVENQIKGRVLFTGSINGFLAEPNHTAYDASKGAIRSLVQSLCVSLAPHGIRVNSIAPGLVVTPLTAPGLMPGQSGLTWMQLHTPNGQVPDADACAGAALFLLSDEAEHIHGQTLLVDGGMSAWQQPNPPAGWK